MTKYSIFAGMKYYPLGGVNDLATDTGQMKAFDTVEEALTEVANMAGIDWWQIVELSFVDGVLTFEKVMEGNRE